jgi:hypothetical protein
MSVRILTAPIPISNYSPGILDYCCALALYTGGRAIIGYLCSVQWSWRFSVRTLLLVTAVVGLLSGIVAIFL